MSHVLFLMLPTPSHYISCLPLAKELLEQGNSISFTGTSQEKDFIKNNNFDFYEFQYMPTFEIRTFKAFTGTLLLSLLNSKNVKKRFKEFKYHVSQAYLMLDLLNPQYVFIDEHMSHYFPYIASRLDKVYIINTKLPSSKSKRIPPFNSSYIPLKNLFSDLICEILWLKQVFIKRRGRLINSIAFLGASNDLFQKREISHCGFAGCFDERTSMYDYDNIRHAISVSLISKQFDFKWRKSIDGEHHFHYWNISAEKLDNSLTSIIESYPSSTPLIYCGIGTMAGKNQDQYLKFLVQLIDALRNTKNYFLIISTGSHYIKTMLFQKTMVPQHVYVYKFVAQKALLRHCSLMITHGGLNSVKECINSCVPMLGILNPSHTQTDTQGNIARIVHHQIGLKCVITDSSAIVAKKISKIINTFSFKENIINLKKSIDSEQKKIHLPLKH